MERASIHSSGAKRIPWSLLSSIFAIVVLPEPGKPHTIINLEPDFSIMWIIPEWLESWHWIDQAGTSGHFQEQFFSLMRSAPIPGAARRPSAERKKLCFKRIRPE